MPVILQFHLTAKNAAALNFETFLMALFFYEQLAV